MSEKTFAEEILEAQKKDDGGYAFPFQAQIRYKDSINEDVVFGGMTLRQYYAGEALNGELSSQTEGSGWSEKTAKDLAKLCIVYADAMIAELRK